MATNRFFFGTEYIAAWNGDQFSSGSLGYISYPSWLGGAGIDGIKYKPTVRFCTNFSLVDDNSYEKMYFGGIPISLVKIGDYYGLFVIRTKRFHRLSGSNDLPVMIPGTNAYVSIYFNNTDFDDTKYALNVNVGNGPMIPSTVSPYRTVFNGIPLGLNSSRELLVAIKTGVPEDYCSVPIGGMPLIMGRFDRNWYLVVAV
jgi:hypothetical protein